MSKRLIDEATVKLVLKKIKAARDCHPNAVDTLLFEAEEILETELAEQPAQQEPVTEAQIVAGARVLNRRMADMCSIDAEDQWKQYGEDFRADARAVLEAAHGIKENT